MSSGALAAAADGRWGRAGRSDPGRLAIEQAILQTVAYADVFDYPLTADEIQRYLIGVSANRGMVRSALRSGGWLGEPLGRSGKFFTLAGRDAIVELRRERAATADSYWRNALRYGHQIGRLPFVRMVAVTGALAMDNIADADIDFFIVTEPGRLWLCRALVVGLVKLAASRGLELCPNYFLSERALVLTECNLFTAHEVAQMVPLCGTATYQRLRELNRWTDRYLPNAGSAPHRFAAVDAAAGRPRRALETVLRTPLGSPFERWEMGRKMRKLGERGSGHAEAAFGPDWCKGHFGDHGQLTLARYRDRLSALGQQPVVI
jgi:hypothetical protein